MVEAEGEHGEEDGALVMAEQVVASGSLSGAVEPSAGAVGGTIRAAAEGAEGALWGSWEGAVGGAWGRRRA